MGLLTLQGPLLVFYHHLTFLLTNLHYPASPPPNIPGIYNPFCGGRVYFLELHITILVTIDLFLGPTSSQSPSSSCNSAVWSSYVSLWASVNASEVSLSEDANIKTITYTDSLHTKAINCLILQWRFRVEGGREGGESVLFILTEIELAHFITSPDDNMFESLLTFKTFKLFCSLKMSLVLIQTSLLFSCKSCFSFASWSTFTWGKQRGLYQNMVTSRLASTQRPGQCITHCRWSWQTSAMMSWNNNYYNYY